ncbi:MAG: histidine kinase dimerization/phosphoacceptor domain -containing protein [Spirochaetia bacterium]
MSYTNTQGIVRASPQLQLGTDLSDRSHIQEVLEHGGFAVGEYVVSRFGQEESLAFAHAVADEQGRIIGALGLVYRLSAYAEIFDQLELPPQTTLNLLDRQGVTLFSYPAGRSKVGEAGLPTGGAEAAATEYPCPGCVALAGRDGTRRYYATRPLYLPGQDTPYLTVMLGIPEERTRAPMIATLRRNTILMAGVVGVALVLVQFFGNIVFGRRLRRLNFVAEQISQGRISADFDLPSDPNEIGRLGRQMQNMADSLEARSRERDLTEKSLHGSLQQKEMLLQEVHHRVKNNVQLILSLVRLQSTQTKSAADGESNFEAFALGLEGRLAAMSEVHEMLYADVDVSEIRLDEFIPRVSRLIRSIYGQLDPEFHLEPVALSLDQAVPVGLIFNEFLTNAYKHGTSPAAAASAQKPPTTQKPPEILLTRVRSGIQLVVRDYGPGLPPEFDPKSSTGLGYTLVQALATQLGGTAIWANSAAAMRTMTGGNAGASSGTTATDTTTEGTTATLEFDLG